LTVPAAIEPRLHLREVADGDRFRLHRWMADPHVGAWFGSRTAAEALLLLARETPSALARLILLEGTPIGYAQALDAEIAEADRRPGWPRGALVLDAFIGEATHRGQGHGAHALTLVRDEVFATTLAPAVVILVPITREDLVRRLEHAGFRWRSIQNDTTRGACWVMMAERAS
jgi:aminoglycoside 6'-N-acetyltransferase